MKYNELKTNREKNAKRVGRGISAGGGKTAGRGTKGQGSRKSGGVRPGFEGGQMPLYMRIPKLRGFRSLKQKPITIKVGQLELVNKTVVDSAALAEAGFIRSVWQPVKVVAGGELKSKKDVYLTAASHGAIEVIKKAGGTFTATERVKQPTKAKAE